MPRNLLKQLDILRLRREPVGGSRSRLLSAQTAETHHMVLQWD